MKTMNWLKQLFSRRRLYGDLSSDIHEHLEEKIEELVSSGMSRKEATAAARRQFGNVTLIEDEGRQVWRWPSLEDLLLDVRYSLRTLRKNPGFTCVTVLTLALGIGANTAIFSVVNGVLLKPLPYPHSERLVGIFLHGGGQDRGVMGNADFQALEQRQQAFEHVAAFSSSRLGFTLAGFGAPQMIPGTSATADFFSGAGRQTSPRPRVSSKRRKTRWPSRRRCKSSFLGRVSSR